MKNAFRNNWKLYLMEAFGLAIFMIAACFCTGILESSNSPLHNVVETAFGRNIILGVLMGLTGAFIFYSPWTSPSGSHINPAVTLTYYLLGKIKKEDALFYVLFQVVGGTLAVYICAWCMQDVLTEAPVNYVVTIPHQNIILVIITEFLIAFVMMSMVLHTSHDKRLSRYTRVFSATLVMLFVIVAGPISGFGMNPARTFASALPSGIWTAFWIYLTMPFAGMLSAAFLFEKVFTTKVLV